MKAKDLQNLITDKEIQNYVVTGCLHIDHNNQTITLKDKKQKTKQKTKLTPIVYTGNSSDLI